MTPDCYPMNILPQVTRLYADYLAIGSANAAPAIRTWYGAAPMSGEWMGRDVAVAHTGPLADALQLQAETLGSGTETFANIERLRQGARAVVTGQQVGLFGGPLLTLLKAATAVARARDAESSTGVPHVPIFWLATEDHDLAEVDQVTFPAKHSLETFSLRLTDEAREVGGVPLGAEVEVLLDQACELMAYAPVCDLLRACYTPHATLGEAFGRFLTSLFTEQGLIVMDAAGPSFHALGSPVLRSAIELAPELEVALLGRAAELESLGYQAQVLVKPGASLLFLLDETTGTRLALRRTREGAWKAGPATYSTQDLLAILAATPERLSPNALLRPVFQDAILPTAAYIGGPAEIAYFAQSAVIYERLLGRLTPVLPRLTATLIEPAIATVMERHELQLSDLLQAKTVEALTQRLGARAMPIEGKRKLAAVGNALDEELTALTDYLAVMDESLGRSANVSASKMRYQMNRLRRMAATFEVQKEASLRRHAQALMQHLFPDGHLQERVLAGAWFLSQSDSLIPTLVKAAQEMCLGHSVLQL